MSDSEKNNAQNQSSPNKKTRKSHYVDREFERRSTVMPQPMSEDIMTSIIKAKKNAKNKDNTNK